MGRGKDPMANKILGLPSLAIGGLAGLLLAGCASAPGAATAPSGESPSVRYSNAYWYDGGEFRRRSFTVQDGVLVAPRGRKADSTVDLGGLYVVPAFAEAHHHTALCNPSRISQFIDAGILYAAIMNARVSSRACQEKLHTPDGLEVVSALAGLTTHDAHPSQIGLYFLESDEISGEWVHYVDDRSDLEKNWPAIIATKPDFLKIFLSYSEDYERLRSDPEIASWYRGLDPTLVATIVEQAHAAGLPVAAHVMSAKDFDVAVSAGVDIIAHMPGFAPGPAFTENDKNPYLLALLEEPQRYLITKASAREAARRGVAVITTVSGSEAPPTPVIKKNFETLSAMHVTLLIGSDRGEFNSVDEAAYLVEHGLMSAADALRSLAVTTPKTLFSDRPIGVLEPGGEASFIVLGANPLEDFSAIRDVQRVVKRGKELKRDAGEQP